MSEDYWNDFWESHGASAADADPQSQVLRTLNKEPIGEDRWSATLGYIKDVVRPRQDCKVLDLGGGNGLISRELAKSSQHVTLVDVSEGLLTQFAKTPSEKIEAIHSDIRTVEFERESFDRIICYAVIQYLSLPESARLFQKIFSWMKPGGRLFVGDIPDSALQWDFFDSEPRRDAYFAHLVAGTPIVGTWFDRRWLENLALSVGFDSVRSMDQPADHIYSWFRFDLVADKS